MNNLKNVTELLSVHLRKIISKTCMDIPISEIRLRTMKPLTLKTEAKEIFISDRGTSCNSTEAYTVTPSDIKETMEYVCNYSLYAYEDEIKNGFITVMGGNRIGICGKTVIQNGMVKTIRNISSINIRIAHEIKGCSDKFIKKLVSDDKLCHVLICSSPGCGKTTMLRDLIRNFSNGTETVKGQNVSLIDERSEVAACYLGVPEMDVGKRTDVLDGCPKTEGMLMALRSMGPEIIAVDEIGDDRDINAIRYAINSGCKILATTHAKDIEELMAKRELQELLFMNDFRIMCLSGYGGPGHVSGIYFRKENKYEPVC